jgi:hypothetical protein
MGAKFRYRDRPSHRQRRCGPLSQRWAPSATSSGRVTTWAARRPSASTPSPGTHGARPTGASLGPFTTRSAHVHLELPPAYPPAPPTCHTTLTTRTLLCLPWSVQVMGSLEELASELLSDSDKDRMLVEAGCQRCPCCTGERYAAVARPPLALCHAGRPRPAPPAPPALPRSRSPLSLARSLTATAVPLCGQALLQPSARDVAGARGRARVGGEEGERGGGGAEGGRGGGGIEQRGRTRGGHRVAGVAHCTGGLPVADRSGLAA